MKSLLLLAVASVAVNANPFDELGKLPALKSYASHKATYPPTPKGATLLSRQDFFDGTRRLTVCAVSFRTAGAIEPLIEFRNRNRQGAAIGLSLPEFEKAGFQVHYIANPQWLEADIIAGRVWVQVSLARGHTVKLGLGDGDREVANEFRADKKSYSLLKSVLPQIERMAKSVNPD